MRDPLAVFETLRDFYVTYYETPFELRDEGLSKERRDLLTSPGEIAQEPLLEVAPRYVSSKRTLARTCSDLGLDPEFAEFASKGLFPPDRKLHLHQHQTLEAAVRRRSFIVTAGTGSGKTESFLLPVIQRLVDESRHWPAPGSPAVPWWRRADAKWESQRAHEPPERLPAIRCLVLYPMNALVEDQLRRLREALDSDAARSWLNDHRGSNRFYFGRYTGMTKPTGERNSPQQLRELRRLLVGQEKVAAKVRADATKRFFFPQLDGAEMRSRWDILTAPPDILITNYSMLNVMLMREREQPIFDATRRWLEADDSNVMTLVVDELHMYRGTEGSEVSLLLRNLRHRLGLDRCPQKLRIFAASASLTGGADGLRYVREFFAEPGFLPSDFYRGEIEAPPAPPAGGIAKHHAAFSAFAQSWTTAGEETERRRSIDTFASCLGRPASDSTLPLDRALGQVAEAALLPNALVGAFDPKTRRPLLLDEIAEGLFPPSATGLDVAGRAKALRGLIISVVEGSDGEGSPLLPVRGHLFFRNIRGAWACSDSECPAVPQRWKSPERKIGKLFIQPQLQCTPECGARVLELLYCEFCGEALLGGYRRSQGDGLASHEYLLPESPDLELLPDLPQSGRTHDRYVVYWPSADPPVDAKPWKIDGAEFAFKPAVYEPKIGRLKRRPAGAAGRVLSVKPPTGDAQPLNALPTRCPRCGEDTELPREWQGQKLSLERRLRSPVRTMGTGFEKVSQVLADAQARLIRDSGAEPKLVVFSDSRQDAAKLSTGLEVSHYQDLVRQIICQIMDSLGDDLRAFLTYIDTGAVSDEAKRYRLSFKDEASALTAVRDGMASPKEEDLAKAIRATVDGPWPMALLLGHTEARLLELGVNPGGPNSDLQRYPFKERRHPWTDLYDFSATPPGMAPGVATDPDKRKLHDAIIEELTKQFHFTLFASRGRDLESLGLGWTTLAPLAGVLPVVRQAADTAIRILGAKRRLIGQRRPLPDMPAYLRKYLEKVADRNAVSPASIKQDVQDLLIRSRSMQPELLLDLRHLYISRPKEEAWECRGCRRLHLQPSGGICSNPECLRELSPVTGTRGAGGLIGRDYYEVLATSAGAPSRLHCEELTGQTDLEDALRRQRLFQGVTIDEDVPEAELRRDIKSVDTVDLLSVTTTMEAGVDIGTLKAIIMSNMPPRRFNYQQRVGRTGRRGDPLSIALTICRGRTHDDFYFKNPKRITGDPPPQPYIDLSRFPIVQRVAAAEALRRAFVALQRDAVSSGTPLDLGNNTHGQFGRVEDWPSYRTGIGAWLNSSSVELAELVAALLASTPLEGPPFPGQLLAFLTNDLVDEIDRAIASGPILQEELAELLANRGLLPMFGFPTRSRLLHTFYPSVKDWPPKKNVIGRDLDIAVSQFAPRAQTVKDKAVHTAVGVVGYKRQGPRIVPVPNPLFSPAQAGLCRNCQALTTRIVQECPACGERDSKKFSIHDLCEPPGFKSDYSWGEPYEGRFEWTAQASRARVAEGEDVSAPRPIGGLAIEVRSGTGSLYSINDNDGEDFKFVPDPGGHGFVVKDAYKQLPAALESLNVEPIRRALASITSTDMLLLGLDESQMPPGLRLSPTDLIGRAAWYSFGFLLRRSAAQILDVDLNELRAGLRVYRKGSAPRAEVFLSDRLQNGAGYSTRLAEDSQLHELFGEIFDRTDSLAAQWPEHRHAGKLCDSSCHDCLRDYGNMSFHGILDWRLALDMAELASGRPLNENRWLDRGPLVAEWLCRSFDWTWRSLGDVVAVDRGAEGVWLLTHPLWDTSDYMGPTLSDAYAEAERHAGGRKIGFFDLFRAIRLPGELAWSA